MDTHASILELKKRAKGDTNKQRRIKNLLAHQEFVEYFEIVRDAKPDLCSLVSASAEEASTPWLGVGLLGPPLPLHLASPKPLSAAQAQVCCQLAPRP